MKAALKAWLPLAVLATFLAGMVYVTGQQILRQSANDPQIQLAEDWASTVVSGTDANRLSLGAFIDPAHSLATFGIVYDQSGNIIASSVSAPSTMKQPDGVFDSVDAAKDNKVRYTWQPASGDRYAVVMKRASLPDNSGKSFYVLAGRNLRVVEDRESHLMWMITFAWLGTLVTLFVLHSVHLVARVGRTRQK